MIFDRKIYHVLCDGCNRFLCDGSGGPRQFDNNVTAINAARDAGWTVNQPGNKDYCPACKSKIRQQ